MTCSVSFFEAMPIAVLFIAVGLGCLLGKLRIGPVALGGGCGTLIVALVLGQTGCQVSGQLREFAFVLFIFAMGYAGGPGFFASLNRSSLRFMALPLMEAVLVVAIVLAAARWFGFDAGTTAGLAAGAVTESAVLGTASEALRQPGLTAAQTQLAQANIATAYSLTYLVGMLSIVFFTSQVAPVLLGINLRQASRKLETRLGHLPGPFQGADADLSQLATRAHLVQQAGGLTVAQAEQRLGGQAAITHVLRAGRKHVVQAREILQPGDIALIIGGRAALQRATEQFGPQTAVPQAHADAAALQVRRVVLHRRGASGRTLAQLAEAAGVRGVVIKQAVRAGHRIPTTQDTPLRYGDVLELAGAQPALEAAIAGVGSELRSDGATDLIFLCAGVLAGLGAGSLSVTLGGLPLSLGSGGGALLSGLACGWIATRYPTLGQVPPAALGLLKDLGMVVFIACVGLSAGPQAITLLKAHGLILPVMGLLVSLVPACASLWIGHKLLKIEGPLLLGAIAGQHVSTPAVSAVIAQAGSPVPILGYTVTYAIANVMLPVLGPLIVALAHRLA
ncbi:aspartate-alanine antiporter [Bordetella trematum]|uniref:aspartate-alanine antiporter-like transporter n=1 Tax=Bordetella trematum TaxID=123899 RepID=UPI0014050BC7|nr:aspartate-alanine antiporter [Bordetella trematum]QIM73109.1 aspartate-alanine antiporter [Bordetella trematum]